MAVQVRWADAKRSRRGQDLVPRCLIDRDAFRKPSGARRPFWFPGQLNAVCSRLRGRSLDPLQAGLHLSLERGRIGQRCRSKQDRQHAIDDPPLSTSRTLDRQSTCQSAPKQFADKGQPEALVLAKGEKRPEWIDHAVLGISRGLTRIVEHLPWQQALAFVVRHPRLALRNDAGGKVEQDGLATLNG